MATVSRGGCGAACWQFEPVLSGTLEQLVVREEEESREVEPLHLEVVVQALLDSLEVVVLLLVRLDEAVDVGDDEAAHVLVDLLVLLQRRQLHAPRGAGYVIAFGRIH